MNIRYCSYDENIISNIEAGAIHLFDKNVDKSEARKIYSGDLFDPQPLLMTFSEFKGSHFLSGKITMKEEKQVITFYKSLSDEHRRRLKIDGYYDAIDIAANFFNFFKMFIEYRIDELDNLKGWQQGIYNLFCDIKTDYLALMKDKNYTDSVFIGTEDNFISNIYEGYKDKEIIIYNKLYFTPREKWIIESLEETGYKFTLKLQLKEGDFCETTYQLKDVSYVENTKPNVYRTDDEFTALLKVIELTDKKDDSQYKIYDANNDNFKYNNFFNEIIYLSEIPIFKLIECFHKLVASLELGGFVDLQKNKAKEDSSLDDIDISLNTKLLINMGSLMEVMELEEFREYYKLLDRDVALIKYLVESGYKFITYDEVQRLIKRWSDENKKSSFIEEDFINLIKIIDDLREMYRISTLKQWCKKLTFTKEIMENFSKNDSKEIGKYFEALSEVEIIEELDLIDTDKHGNKVWNLFFKSNISEGLLRLIMKYHRFKEVASSGHKLKKAPLLDLPTTHEDTRIFLNISDTFVPENKGSSFLLTETQKKDLGIKNLDDDRVLEKYNLLRGIMTSKESYVISVENQGNNISLSPFIEEIINEDTLDTKVNLDTTNYLDLIKSSIKTTDSIDFSIDPLDTHLVFNIEELQKKKNMSAYMCDELFNCQYKMYLRYILRFSKENIVVDEGLTRREYGNLAHDIFEEVLNRYIKEPKNYEPLQGQEIDVSKIHTIVERLIDQAGRRLKLPHLNNNYYQEIIYKNLAESVRRFFREISKVLRGQIVTSISVEQYERKEIHSGIYQSAMGDLIIDTNVGKHIIDFKTGGKIDRQLDYYGILYTGSADGARRYIYNIDKNLLDEAEKVTMTREDLVQEVDSLLNKDTYERTYTSKCGRCEYWVVCKEVEKNV